MSQYFDPAKDQESQNERIISVKGMYKDYFLDYASYVILERAVPALEDGLKPVQRRILHALREMDDGRYNKVANIIGQTMQYHPHGDAAIGDAMINLGQKELLIDCQGNWGDIRTGDGAAAPRYIEARLTKFAHEVAFNKQTTIWQLSYDGRKNEPVNLPMKFPLLLAQGVEGIAVGLSTKIMPHNFIELIDASVAYLKGDSFQLYPDFLTGGSIDVTDYNDGQRGGKIRVRAKIDSSDKKNLYIRELPYGVTTTALIDSIVKASDKGKIKIKKIIDNTAAEVEIIIELMPGVSPDVTMDALFAFTACEVSISPNACVIIEDKPHFVTVSDMLIYATELSKKLLGWELDIKKNELEESWLFASLEKIFIENRIYHDIEECETWEAVMTTIEAGIKKYVATPSEYQGKSDKRLQILRELTNEDYTKLTEIRIKRITKFNSFKAEEYIKQLESELQEVKFNIANLNDFTISYYQRLREKYGKGRERKTEIKNFDTIRAQEVVANNAKLYANLKEGFIGFGLKKDEFIADCSDIDDIISFRKDGKFNVVRIADKVFVGKDLIYTNVWKKNDERTTYNLIYLDGKSGKTFAKRFNVVGITRDKEYDLTQGAPNSKVLYFSVNPNGESETVAITLSPNSSARVKLFEFDFGELAIKGRSSQGNTITKYPVRKIVQKELGKSTLGAKSYWFDETTGKLNNEERGRKIGAFDTGDLILSIYKDGYYQINEPDTTTRYEVEKLLDINKFDPERIVNALYYEAEKGWTMVKRFKIETSSIGQKFKFISEHKNSKLYFATLMPDTKVYCVWDTGKKTVEQEVILDDFVSVKGWKSMGNKLCDFSLLEAEMKVIEHLPIPEKLHPGDHVDFEINQKGQGKLFED
ncbi:MAG: DNA gyrase/topoisomerase IV subunit A [Saprospiraceae bacterium]|nr:DNA gyrase/topoisomerase IV subunit A [Saprospiraceae bacterium]